MTVTITKRGSGITFECRVTARASKSDIKGVRDGVLLLSLAAPPIDGKANEELIRFLSEILNISKSRITILRGERAKMKLLFIDGVGREHIDAVILKRPARHASVAKRAGTEGSR